MEKTKNRKTFFYILTIFLIFFATLFISEALLRVYGLFYPNLFTSSDLSYNRFRGIPYTNVNGFQLNSHGFQDLEFEKQKKMGTHRIVALGDSFAFGIVPYKNNSLTLLEDQLNSRVEKYEIINMGIPAMGMDDYMSLLIYEGLDAKPDTVLLYFFIGNDIYDHIRKDAERLYILTFYRYLKAYIKIQSDSIKPTINPFQPGENKYNDTLKTFNDKDFLKVEKSRSIVFSRNPIVFQYLKEIYKSIFRTFDQIKKICDSKKINLIVVFIPDELQVNEDIQDSLRTFSATTAAINPLIPNEYLANLDYDIPNLILRKELNDRNILFFDLLEPFREKSKKVNLYKPNDTHWNIAGNQFAAELIEEFLLKRLKHTP